MSPCASQHHAQVPVTTNGVFITYCHQCQSFKVSMWRNTVYNDDDLVEDLYKEYDLGPFDGVDRVLEIATRYITELLGGSGLPWDRSGW